MPKTSKQLKIKNISLKIYQWTMLSSLNRLSENIYLFKSESAQAMVLRSKDRLWELVLSGHMDPRDQLRKQVSHWAALSPLLIARVLTIYWKTYICQQ